MKNKWKFKVGDKVKIRSDIQQEVEYGRYATLFVTQMSKYKDKILTIYRRDEGLEDTYLIKDDNQQWCWAAEMLELAMPPIIKDGVEYV